MTKFTKLLGVSLLVSMFMVAPARAAGISNYIDTLTNNQAEIQNQITKIIEQNKEQKRLNLGIELEEINNIEDSLERYLAYKELVFNNNDVLDAPETIYDYYTEEEIAILWRIVEAEATAGDFDNKVNVANVVFNRVDSEDFPDTISDIVFQKNSKVTQFSPVSDGRFWKIEVSEETKLACEYAFIFEDTTNGALYFTKNATGFFKTLDYIMTDSIGHDFYR
ncbi:cell wall hydrolase [Konateibacter massiliensis]|uniref:cell wall hydrolase n=1 Tax=Konateibacter massiliensis TaxID=2002841 RepID=UPI000C15B095|nr:cell wall hydrolase [Konateibacter massiliensis]